MVFSTGYEATTKNQSGRTSTFSLHRHFKVQDSRGVTQQIFEVVRTLKGAPEAEAALCFCAFCVATIHLPASVQLPSLAGSVGFDYLDLQTSLRA